MALSTIYLLNLACEQKKSGHHCPVLLVCKGLNSQPLFFSLAVDAKVHVVPLGQAEPGRNSDRRNRNPDLGKSKAPRCREANHCKAFPGELMNASNIDAGFLHKIPNSKKKKTITIMTDFICEDY